MSETEPIPPTSSVTALRIPIIKKGEYDLWSMKMRQYIAITDHILWDIITNGNQTTTDPASPSVALFSVLMMLVDASLYGTAIRARFGGTKASKKMQRISSMPTTHDDEDLLQIDEDAMEEIDIRWQVAMITARIRKFMRKTGRPIDLKPKNGITFDKSKIECFNCQKLGHFARECRFAKYQENRANGRQEKKTVAIEDSNSKALVATDNNEDIDWTKEFDAEPVTYAMMALTGVEQDDWSMEFDAEHVHFGQDGLGDFDWSNKDDDTPSFEIEGKTKGELDQTLKECDDFKVKLEKWSNASVLQNEVLNKQRYVSDKSCIGFGIESSDISSGDETLTALHMKLQKRKGLQSQYLHLQDWVDSDDEESDVSEVKRKMFLNTRIVKNPLKTGASERDTHGTYAIIDSGWLLEIKNVLSYLHSSSLLDEGSVDEAVLWQEDMGMST
ncbi:ribonuclease H-like domain-containing protein [Tanacetum coccineum]